MLQTNNNLLPHVEFVETYQVMDTSSPGSSKEFVYSFVDTYRYIDLESTEVPNSNKVIYEKMPWGGYKLLKELVLEIIYEPDGVLIRNKELHIEIFSEDKNESLVEFFEYLVDEFEFLSSLLPSERIDGMADLWEAYQKYLTPV